ncbi:DUF502 domain-containing protein [Kordiimonas aestuarii]|uniref:DUF502 domain-containing protein n=1 Tax=Kordiimonas aestuarii TaxID=1005925 RepID=UPI0021CF956F|nr:DUF502 domain-containing protein [Kordiimonas aestuarii]
MPQGDKNSFLAKARHNMFVGLFTLIPIWLTLLLLDVILQFIHQLASPIIDVLTAWADPGGAAFHLVKHPWFQTTLAVIIMLSLLYLVGWLASRWFGQRFLLLLDDLIQRVPVARTIYNTIKRLAEAMQTNSDDVERVVLIEFPSADMKTVGLVTRTFKDSRTGRELAAVYVPTTPNPTSGYLEIVPVENIVPTNWKLDEAMSFIISGGADVPKTFVYDRAPVDEEELIKPDTTPKAGHPGER